MTFTRPVQIRIRGGDTIEGDLTLPESPSALIVFAHGSGSSRHSSRNKSVAQALNQRGLATLLFDLLTSREEGLDQATGHLRFDIPLLANRLLAAMQWCRQDREVSSLPLGLFGASTGAAAALIAAAQQPEQVYAVVSRGGRPDLAGQYLPSVQAPTLLLVGGYDDVVIGLNQQALAQLTGARAAELVVVPRASHLFEEPGKLDEVARLAGDWFERQLALTAQSGHPR